jgi:hypothetical protein
VAGRPLLPLLVLELALAVLAEPDLVEHEQEDRPCAEGDEPDADGGGDDGAADDAHRCARQYQEQRGAVGEYAGAGGDSRKVRLEAQEGFVVIAQSVTR